MHHLRHTAARLLLLLLFAAALLLPALAQAQGGWAATRGSMAEKRYSHTATLLPDGRVLAVGGEWLPGSAELFDPATGQWHAAGNLSASWPRSHHTATLLHDGRVLVAGGHGGGRHSSLSAELYDSAANTWQATTGALRTDRARHTATLLRDGRVLVLGGVIVDSSTHLRSAEIYDPGNRFWRPAADMSAVRTEATATLLPDGRVLVAGGGDRGWGYLATSTAWLYDQANDRWDAVASLPQAREMHTATLLPDGQVLLAGGRGSGGASLAEAVLYDPGANQWTQAGSLDTARHSATATLLPSGQVLIAGGTSDGGGSGALAGAELYTLPAATVTPTTMPEGRDQHTAVLLPDGSVLVTGGLGGHNDKLASVRRWQPGTGWTSAASLPHARADHSTTLLPDGRVFVVGGIVGGHINLYTLALLYNPVANTWVNTTAIPEWRGKHTATLLRNGQVLVAGGWNGAYLDSAWLYNPVTEQWTGTGRMTSRRADHSSTLLADGRVLVAGGRDGPLFLASAEIYDPATGQWTATTGSMTQSYGRSAALLADGRVLVAGGAGGSAGDRAELYDPGTDAWQAAASLPRRQADVELVTLPDGRVLLAGAGGAGSRAFFIYDPAVGNTGQWSQFADRLSAVNESMRSVTLLADGRVLVAGGRSSNYLDTADIIDLRPAAAAARAPQLNAPASPVLRPGTALTFTGARLHGDSEAGGGTPGSAAHNLPLLQLQAVQGGAIRWLKPASSSASQYTSQPLPAALMPAGWWAARVFVNGIASNPVMLRAPQVPGAPRNLAATPGNGSVRLTWSAPTDDGGAPVTDYSVTVDGNAATCAASGCTITGLTNGTAYAFSVTAVNAVGSGPAAPAVSATPRTVPGAPQNLTATPGDGRVELSWDAPASDGGNAITRYTVTGASNTCTASPCVITGLSNGTAYAFAVQAVNAAGPGAAAQISATPRTAPGAPQNLVATPGDGSVQLAWDAPASNGGNTITGYSVTMNGSPATCAASGCTIPGLTNGTAYAFTVQAVNAAGSGAAAQISATPRTVPGAPQNFTATPGDASVRLTWDAPASDGGSAVTGYSVTMDGHATTCTASPCSLTGLSNGTAHTFTVQAVNDAGDGPTAQTSATPATQTRPRIPLPDGGEAEVEIGGNPPGCTVTQLAIDTNVPPGAPAGARFPLGVLHFTAEGCAGATLAVRVTYPGSVANLSLMKHGPTASDPQPQWFELTGAQVSSDGRTVEFSITDDGEGDGETQAAGVIRDPFAPMALASAVQPVPSLGTWGLLLLSALLGLAGARRRV